MKYCPRCGYPNPDDAKFCMRCGYQFPGMTQQPPTQPYPRPPPIPAPSYPQQPSYSQPPRKGKIPIIPIVSLIAVVIVVVVVLTVVLPGITSSGGNVLVSAADHAFGGNWKIESDRSSTVTVSGNTVTVAYLNGTTITESLSNFIYSNPLGQLLLSAIQNGISKVSSYTLVNGTSTINMVVVYNLNNYPTLESSVMQYEESHETYNYTGGTYYMNYLHDQIFTIYNGNLYLIAIYGFYPKVAQITTFLNNAVA